MGSKGMEWAQAVMLSESVTYMKLSVLRSGCCVVLSLKDGVGAEVGEDIRRCHTIAAAVQDAMAE
jgi:hypothetical protein